MYPEHLKLLIEQFRRLPGVGSRSAERYAFQLLDWKEEERQTMAEALSATSANLRHCDECGSLIGPEECHLCGERAIRDRTKLCVVSTAKEVFAIEDTAQYKGLYHVLGGTLSPIDGRGPEQLRFAQLWPRLAHVEEVIVALDSTLEGDATALYIRRELEESPVTVSRLAFGLPSGCSLDLVDESTLTRALTGRRPETSH